MEKIILALGMAISPAQTSLFYLISYFSTNSVVDNEIVRCLYINKFGQKCKRKVFRKAFKVCASLPYVVGLKEMGWKDIFIKRAENWTFGSLNASQVPGSSTTALIEPNKAYIKIILRSLRIVNIRKIHKKFFGAVHSFISLGHYDEKAEFHVLTTPTKLKDIDAAHIDRVISFNKYLLNSVPYRGGGVSIELGLFSIESADLADSFLKVLEGMSEAAGVSFVSTAIPFAKPLTDGINLLVGTTNPEILEIGLSTNLIKPSTGTFVVIRAPQGEIDLSKLKLDDAFRLIDQSGKAIGDYPYLVFSIESNSDRENWYEIPELTKAWKDLREVAKQGDVKKTQEAFIAFKRIVITSPDLIDDHADKLVEDARVMVDRLMTITRTRTQKGIDIGDLKQIKLFG